MKPIDTQITQKLKIDQLANDMATVTGYNECVSDLVILAQREDITTFMDLINAITEEAEQRLIEMYEKQEEYRSQFN